MKTAESAPDDSTRQFYRAKACMVSYEELSQPPEGMSDVECVKAADAASANKGRLDSGLATDLMKAACKHGGESLCHQAARATEQTVAHQMQRFTCETYGDAACSKVGGKMPTETLKDRCIANGDCDGYHARVLEEHGAEQATKNVKHWLMYGCVKRNREPTCRKLAETGITKEAAIAEYEREDRVVAGIMQNSAQRVDCAEASNCLERRCSREHACVARCTQQQLACSNTHPVETCKALGDRCTNACGGGACFQRCFQLQAACRDH